LSACATAAGERIDARAIGELELWCVDTRASAAALFAVEQDVALLSEWERRRAATFFKAAIQALQGAVDCHDTPVDV